MSKLSRWKPTCVAYVLCAAAAVASPASAQVTFTILADFDGSNGVSALGSLVQGLDGNFYGTTFGGGANNFGTVSKITPMGTLSTLYSFCSQPNCADGENPQAGLVLGADGNFYGTTAGGGAGIYYGTVFRVTPKGALTTLYSFCGQSNCADGANPVSALTLGADGNFYGTTLVGGTFYGTVFRITPGGALTTLYSFTGQDGGNPTGGLVQATNGDFYGTTSDGGGVFKITAGGSFTLLYTFQGGPSGSEPTGLVQASNGNFYGTTYSSGDYYFGTVFEITPWGTLTTLHMFTGASDGGNPSQLVQATDGNLYGITQSGGDFSNECANSEGCGTVFKITPQGRLTTLHKFCAQSDCPDGNYPYAGLLQATDGNFYGTTIAGGSDAEGTVFGLSVQLAPFVETLPASGRVGKTVKILGTNLAGATSVTFNGAAATFTVVSKTAISATVPTGATTGTVQVTTPSGTLSSNVPFRVLQ